MVRLWVLLLLLVCSQIARAATFNINDGNIAGLISAINTSNSNNQDDTINLAANGSYILTVPDNGSNGLPVIGIDNAHNLTINGNGAVIRRSSDSGTPEFRIFAMAIHFGNTVTISNLIITNGSVSNGQGGAVTTTDATMLSLINCTITGNQASIGGGIFTKGVTTLTNCCVIGNSALHGSGGAIFNSSFNNADSATADLYLINCTFSGNSALAEGGAILNSANNEGGAAEARVTVTNCTFANNAANTAGGIFNDSFNGLATVLLRNSIFANSTLSNYANPGNANTINTAGYNLSTDDGGGFLTGGGDQINTDPKFDPAGLADNGGPTQTIALAYGSPAIDRGYSFGVTTDQRGVARPFDNANITNAVGGDGSDIGAYEAPADPVQSGTFYTVNTLADHDDGVCSGADCTLREAITRSNSFAATTVTFAPGLTGTITLSSTLGELRVVTNMYIQGPGARMLAVSGGGTSRVFSHGAGQLTISGLTIRNGNYAPAQSQGETRQGGGIYSTGVLSLSDCAIINNSVAGAANSNNGGNGGAGEGGAIYNSAALTLNGCTFSGNTAIGAAGTAFSAGGTLGPGGNGGAAQGGAVFNDTAGNLSIINCTFNGNFASGGAGGAGSGTILSGGGNANGGAVYSLGHLTVYSATVSGNTGTGGPGASAGPRHGAHGTGNGGLSAGAGSTDTIADTIVAGNSGNTAADAEGAFTSNGYNLIGIGDQSSGFGGTGDQVGTAAAPINPKLGGLQNNGGPTDTMTILYGSSALDQGKRFGLTKDQRTSYRPMDTIFGNAGGGDGSDIGAVEMNLFGGGDSDGDGMSDDFEKFYGFNPNDMNDRNIDNDGDGMTNVQEFKAGTDPLDANSSLRVIAMAQNGTDIDITFRIAVADKAYRLERKDALTDSTWNSISGVVDLGVSTTGPVQISDPNGAAVTRHFYRVRVLP